MSFKNINNMFLLGSLFYERNLLNPEQDRKPEYVKFSLHDDRPGLVNARKAFVALEDPTGYEFAMRYLNGSFEHWTRLMACDWFKEAYRLWMGELNAKFKAKAFRKIRDLADGDDTPPAVKLQANKYLHSLDKPTSNRGRPSGEEVTGELKRLAEEARSVKEDMERIGLKAN